jgi:hypothetical protein
VAANPTLTNRPDPNSKLSEVNRNRHLLFVTLLRSQIRLISMLKTIDQLLDDLVADPWRQSQPFSADMAKVHAVLFDPTKIRQHQQIVLDWVKREQPCLFGRMAADEQIEICILTERDIYRGEEYVKSVMAAHRLQWKRQGSVGKQHGFIISLVSPRIAQATPSSELRDLALRLLEIYLSEQQIAPDEIFLDSLPLRIVRTDGAQCRNWSAGVNFFGAQGDQRWWHDHRFPGGIAFSMNSVGHMTRSRLEAALPEHPNLQRITPTDRLVDFALYFAMKTIHKASLGALPGTKLAPREALCVLGGSARGSVLRDMQAYNERMYFGQYHTDVTVPSEHFDPAVKRSTDAPMRDLLFTYLHDQNDPDYGLMGLGAEISPEEVFAALGWTA